MRIPFLAGGRSAGDDPERKKLLVPEGRVPRPFPGPWTLRALVRGDGPGDPLPAAGEEGEEPGPSTPAPDADGSSPDQDPL
ncbi:hypothetical protein BH23GEM11_BH23GEM11_13900 [soil metagenome]